MVFPVYKSDITKPLSIEDVKKVIGGEAFGRCSITNMANVGVEFACPSDNGDCCYCYISKDNTAELSIALKKHHIQVVKSS